MTETKSSLLVNIFAMEVMVIKKLRLYLETSVCNYYFDENREGHEDTIRLFEAIGAGDFEAYTSEYVTLELKRAYEPKRGNMINLLEKYNVTVLDYNEDAERLAFLYVNNNIIPARFWLDCAHIAIATVHKLDCVISYNFEHINRTKTKILVGEVNFQEKYRNVTICTSKEVLDYEI